jgi:hypothetical protein
MYNHREELLGCISIERHAAYQELVEDDAHRPPIHWLAVAVALTQDYLRGYVGLLRGAEYLLVQKQLCVLLQTSFVQIRGH